MKKIILCLIIVLMLIGCAATGERYRADVYSSSHVNQAQQGTIITIKTVTPTKIEVDNSEQRRKAEIAGGSIGALAGGLGLGLGTKSRGAGVLGAIGGGVIGAGAGSMISDKILVDGVTITYKVNGKLFSSTQVGRTCEFIENEDALMIITDYNETRIQPNTKCPN